MYKGENTGDHDYERVVLDATSQLISPGSNSVLEPSVLVYFPAASNTTNHAFRMLPFPGNTASCMNIQLDDWCVFGACCVCH